MQILIVLAYLILTIVIGLYSKKKIKSSKTFDGVGLGTLMCVCVGAGEWIGGTATTGISEYGYEYGISGAWYTIANGIGMFFLALFFAKLYRSMKTPTVTGILGKYIGNRARIVASVLSIFLTIVLGSIPIIAIGTIGETLFHINAAVSILIMGAGVLLYTVFGGMMAVGYTNIMHMVVLYSGIILAVILCLGGIDGGFSTLKDTLPASYFSLTGIGMPKISSWVVASLLGACVSQAGLQPILASKDIKTAVRSSYIIAIIVGVFGFMTAILGMIAKVQFPGLADAKLALPTLMMSLNPISGGLVMAAIIAAVLSTASPIFLACGTLFTRDIYLETKLGRDRKDDDAHVLKVSRYVTLIAGITSIVLALIYYRQKALDIAYFAYSIRASLFVVLLLGIYWRKTSQKAANIAMLSTGLVGLFWIIYKNVVGQYPIHPNFSETYAAILTSLIVTVVGSIIAYKRKNK